MDSAAQQQQQQPLEPEAFSQYPAPPAFYKLYEAGADAGPPAPLPVKGHIHALGEIFDTDAQYVSPLEVPQMFEVQANGIVDMKVELSKLNKGLLFLFIELLNALVQQPSAYATALSPVLVTLHNMMHLINMARHHQARETLKLALQTQIQQKQAALDDLVEQANVAKSSLLAITQRLAAVGSDAAESVRQQKNMLSLAPMEEG